MVKRIKERQKKEFHDNCCIRKSNIVIKSQERSTSIFSYEYPYIVKRKDYEVFNKMISKENTTLNGLLSNSRN